MRRTSFICFVFCACASIASAEWKPAPVPISTRWAKDVTPDKVHPEYPRPQFVRKDWQNLNGLWEFAVGKSNDTPPIGRKLERQILVPFPIESSLSGIGEKATDVWYRRTFNVDDWIKMGKRVHLHFGAVDWESNIWINGRWVGDHRGGYDGFSFDITDLLKPSGEQEIVVGVWDPSDQGFQPCGKQAVKPEGIWYTSTTGIWQTVWLEPVSPTHIASVRLTPDIDKGHLHVEAAITGLQGDGHVECIARDPHEKTKVVGKARLRVDQSTGKAIGDLSIDNVKLWSPDAPALYDLEITLDASQPGIDRVNSYFGMRKISLVKDANGVTRLFLNNGEVFQFGPLDQGFWPDGLYTAPTDEALRYDIEITKQLGFNMCRKHVKVEPDRWYYWADKLGLLVWQDMPSGEQRIAPGFPDIKRSAQSARQFENELKAMITNLHNHPSIVHWVVFNEGWGQYETKRLTDFAKGLDSSRLVIGVSGWNDRKTGDIHDIHHYPPPRSPKAEKNRAVVNGEYGGLGLPVELHTWQGKNNWGYQQLKSNEELMNKYAQFIDQVRVLRGTPGMSAAVYTQITDVEIEVNGLLTYDRELIKGDLYRYRELNTSVHRPPPTLNSLLPTSRDKAQSWRFTFEKPTEGWHGKEFDDSSWKIGEAGFGKPDTPGTKVRTGWKESDIWLRKAFELPDRPFAELFFDVHHDDNVEIYINGELVKTLDKWTSDYGLVPLGEEAKKHLKPGANVIAVHCHQDAGGQYIDLGIVERVDHQK